MKIRRRVLTLFVLSIAFLLYAHQGQAQASACLYALDPSAQGAFSISGSTSISTSCSAVVESSGSQAFEMSGSEIFYMQNSAQVGVVGGSQLSGQSKIVNQSTGQTEQPVKISSPGDPLAFLPLPTSSTIVGKSHTSYDMNNKPPNNTLSPGIYCGGLAVGNTNGTTFTMSPGTYIMAGGGFTLNSLAVVSGTGVTVYNTSSTGWGCSGSSSYTPITISGQVTVNLTAPTTGSLTGIVFFGDRAGCSTVGSCQDQINGSSSTILNGAMYFKSDTLLFTGSTSYGCMMAVADKININGNSSFAITGCTGTMGGVSVSVTPTTATLYGGQTQQFTATVTNASSTGVNWSISPSSAGTINSSGLYTAPASVTSQQTVTITATSQAESTVSSSATVTLMPKTTPTITWSAPAAITYGTALTATQLDATASVAGTFVYSPAAGTVLAPGSQTLSVTFTPTNTTIYNTATATVLLTVNKVTPVITWAAPAAITYGTALSATQLDATASVAGTFVYTPAAGTVLAAGSQTLSVTFTPTNTTDYSTTTFTVTLTVNDATPAITWATPAAITYGTALSATQLDATASVAGTFVYSPAVGTVLAAGSQTLSVTFTPTNTTDYSTATASVLLIVNKAAPVITWAAPAAITYGTALSATQLDATANVAGTFAYTPAAGTVLAAGSQTLSVTFTPTNTTDYSTATATTALTVSQAAPVITWAAPAAITYGTALNATQLDATANVAGTFVYTPAAGNVPAAGSQTLSVTFTPTDTTDYSTATSTVTLTVNKATPVITWATPAAIIYGTTLGTTQLDATASVAGTFVYTPAAGTVLAVGSQTLSVTFTPTNTTDYTAATSTVTLTVQPLAPPTITATPSPAPNAAGWNNSNVTVTFACTAGSYPIKTCPSPVVVSTQAANQVITGTATDTNGNTASASVTVNLDTTPPTITASASPAPNAAGWNTTSVTVTFTCADTLSGVASCPAAQSITTAGANQIVKGTATDVAGNTASTQVTVNISKTPPTITPLVSPSPNAAGWNDSPVTVSFTCTPGGAPIASCPSSTVVTTQGSNIPVTGTVTDAAGATATATVVIKLDSTPPTIIPNLSPAPNSNGWETSPVTVSFTCSDSLSGVATCPSSTVISSNGANQTVSGTATDVAGNTATATANVNLEQSGPTITASLSPTANSAGWNDSNVIVTFTCNSSVSPIASCSPAQTVSSQGVGQVVSGTVQDQAGNQATTSVTLNIDKTPPAILQFTAPSQLSPGQSGSATLTVTDIAPIASVVFELNGTEVGTALAPPYTVSVTAPTTATSGSTLTLTAVVTDVAGNVASANAGIQIAASGVIVGEVLSDATGLPLAGANLQVIGQTGQSTTSNAQGQYSIPVTSSQLFLSVSQPGNSNGTPAMVTVERQVAVQSGVGTVPVDARMTALAAPVIITASGGTIGTGAITVTVPAGGATTSYNLTPLSQQGLPGLLPLGWSPVAAFDLQTNISTSASLSANFTGLPTGTLYLVSYSYNVHAWTMVTSNLSAPSGALTVPLPATGDYALVAPDASNTSILIPAVGQPLTGVPMVSLPTNATSVGSLSPSNIAPTGGTSTASLAVVTSVALPSGTVIQSQVTETYTLTSGQALSEEPRYEDILLYQNPTPNGGGIVGAAFPVTPSQTFQVSQLTSGDVHLNILSGRESVRGATGGSDPVSVQSGGATLNVAAGSLSQDTAIAVSSEPVNTFLPSTSTLVPLSEYNVDFSGQVLSNAAQLSVGAGTAVPGSNVVIAQIQRVAGVPYLVVVSTAQVTATNIVTQATPGLPGIIQGGDYVFYELTVPTGFVNGMVSAGSGPVTAMIQTDALPFVAFSNANGNYMVAAAAGTVNLTATVPNTALAGTATTQVIAGQTATANLTVAGQVEAASITPANGAVGVPLTAEIDITAAEGFNQATVTSSSVVLTAAGSNTPIALRFVYSGGGTTLAVFPQAALQPSTQYAFQASGLANALGGLISVPAISFTTVAITAPSYNTNALVFAMPDSNGNVAINAPAGSFPPGSTFLIVDQTNGVVYSLTVLNDGSVTGQMPATINDLLQITFTDPAGNITSFTRSQFVAADGTVAVGPGGGTVAGPGGTALIIPAGALTTGATFKLAVVDQSSIPDMPAVDGLQWGTGLTVQTSGVQQFNQEVKMVFPVPSGAPDGAQYYVYRRVTFPDASIGYEVIDEALVQGTGSSAQVVTASPPFPGYITVINGIDTFLCTYIYTPQSPSVFTQGAITGKVLGSSYQAGSSAAVTVGIPGAQVRTQKPGVVDSATRKSVFATTQPCGPTSQSCGVYTLWDPSFTGGTITVTASSIPSNFLPLNGPATYQTTASEIQSTDSLWTVIANSLLGQGHYLNVAYGDITVPPPAPPQPPPAFQISVMLVNNGTRTATTGIVTAGASLIIGVNPQPGSQAVVLNGTTIAVNGQGVNDQTDSQGQFAVIAPYTPANPNVYTVQVTVANAFGGPPTTASYTFRAIAAGGSGSTTTVGQAPTILTGQSYPTNGASQVPVTVNPQIVFSEPVTIPAGSVQLQNAGNVIPTLIGGVDNNGNPYSNITQAPAGTAFTSITIQPQQALHYSGSVNDPQGTYQIVLSQAIKDLNQPTPFSLVAGSSPITFYTLQIPVLSTGGSAFASPGIFVAKNRAYVAQIDPSSLAYATVWQYNVSDPGKPGALGPSSNGGAIEGRADYVTGQDNSSEAGGQTLVAVSVAPYPPAPDQPGQTSHVMLYKGTSSDGNSGNPDSLTWIGAVSLTQGATDGTVSSIAVQGNRLYAATLRKGIQVVDLDQVISEFQGALQVTVNYNINTAGQGFANDAVIATIGVQSDPTLEYLDALEDVKVANYPAAGGQNQTLVVATGSVPSAPGSATGVSFVVADPNAVAIVSKITPQSNAGSLTRGAALALGPIQTATTVKNIVAVVGYGSATGCASCTVLAVMDMTTPAQPQPLSFTVLSGTPSAVVLNGNTAIVGYSSDASDLFDLTNPASPQFLGTITGVGGSLFLYNGGTLFSTGAVPGVPNSPLGGIHAASFNAIQLAWQQLNSTLDTNPNVGGGLRIFPDKQTSADGINRSLVGLTAQVKPATAGVPVYFRVFDVPDPSVPNSPANDNNGTPKYGTLSAGSALTDITGTATVTFAVTMQPGDNFVAAASTSASQLIAVNVTAQGLQDAAGNPLPDAAISTTPMLTVWRNLHIEADTMGAVVGNYKTGNITNFAQNELTVDTNLDDGSLNLDSAPQAGNGRFENGSITAAGVMQVLVQANGVHRVDSAFGFGAISQVEMQFTAANGQANTAGTSLGFAGAAGNWAFSVQVPHTDPATAWGGFVGGTMSIAGGPGMTITAVQDNGTVPQNPGPGVPQFDTAQITVSNLEIPFNLVDDDVIPPGALALPDNSLMAAAFGQGYIRPVYDVPSNRNVNFVLNLAVFDANGNPTLDTTVDYNFTAKPQVPDPAYWVIYNLSSYQGDTIYDHDPNLERTLYGVSNEIGGYGMQVFKESLRDQAANNVQNYDPQFSNEAATVAHEVGHIMGGEHPDGGLMASTGIRNSLQFTQTTLCWMRQVVKINQQQRIGSPGAVCVPGQPLH